ncbi:MAG: hypothetical protein NW226_24065 [Microscillaceae bacterium]|nr:hypothetical protein [Microscillaceae bacterium]
MKLLNYAILLIIGFLFTHCENADSLSAESPNPSSDGRGGSLARFAIAGDYLYTVSNKDLTSYNISNPAEPQKSSDIEIGANIETIFPYNNMLFIGSQTGMLIYDNSQPSKPRYVSRYDHIMSCDPVVVQGDYAYVTLRDGTDCRFGSNLLDVIDISDPTNPQLVNSYSMIHPHGLGVDGNNLFVCEGQHGLKVFNLSNPQSPLESKFIQDVRTYDVIPNQGLLIVTGEDGIFQYLYNQNQELVLLSELE